MERFSASVRHYAHLDSRDLALMASSGLWDDLFTFSCEPLDSGLRESISERVSHVWRNERTETKVRANYCRLICGLARRGLYKDCV